MAKSVVEDIIAKNAEFIKKGKKTEQWIAEYDEKKYKIAFEPKKEMIITVYPSFKSKTKKPKRKIKIRHKSGQKIEKNVYKKGSYKRNKKVEYEGAI